MRYRSVFVSDVHLGTRDCRADFLLDFLRRVRTDRLYLVGDIVDLEALQQAPYWPAAHGDVLAELFYLAASGTRVTYIPGNHDAPLRALVGQRIGGIEVKREAVHTTADGRRFRVSHGDEFDPEHQGKSWLVALGERAHRLICAANRTVNALRRRLGKPYLPLAILANGRIARALAYIRRYEDLATSRARAAGLDGQICGHIHFGNLREVEGVLYLNDGDWVEHCTALVEHDDGALELLHWSERCESLARLDAAPALAEAWARAA